MKEQKSGKKYCYKIHKLRGETLPQFTGKYAKHSWEAHKKKRCQHKDQGKRNSAGYRAKAGLFQGGSASGDAFLLIGKVLPSQNYKRRG